MKNEPVEQALDAVDFQSGDRVGGFILQRQIGFGTMGKTWHALRESGGEPVAVKFMDRNPPVEWVQRFEREVACQRRIESPYVVRCSGQGEARGRRFSVLQYIEGDNLHRLLKAEPDGRLDEARVLRIAWQVLKAVQSLEVEGLLHRDIKPQNILVGGDDAVHLSDFGLVKVMAEYREGEEARTSGRILTPVNTTLGTAEYMSPEQSLGVNLDVRSDLYSLGAVMYRMLTGVSPFRGANTGETLSLLLQQPLTPVLEHNPRVTPGTVALVEQLLAKERVRRPRSTVNVEKRILACYHRIVPADRVKLPAVPPDPVRPVWILAAGVVLAVCFGAGVGVMYLMRMWLGT